MGENTKAPMYHPQSQRLLKWCIYLESGAQDEQNEHQHRSFSLARTSVASNGPLLPSNFSLNWENPNMGR